MNQTGKIEFRNKSQRPRLNYLYSILFIVLGLAIMALIPLVSVYWGDTYQFDYQSSILFLGICSIIICSQKTLIRLQFDYQARVITIEYIFAVSPVIKRFIPFEHLQIKLKWEEDKSNTLESIRIFNLRTPIMKLSAAQAGLPEDTLKELKIKLEEITTANTTQNPTTSPFPAQG